jgi:hypothetical protein
MLSQLNTAAHTTINNMMWCASLQELLLSNPDDRATIANRYAAHLNDASFIQVVTDTSVPVDVRKKLCATTATPARLHAVTNLKIPAALKKELAKATVSPDMVRIWIDTKNASMLKSSAKHLYTVELSDSDLAAVATLTKDAPLVCRYLHRLAEIEDLSGFQALFDAGVVKVSSPSSVRSALSDVCTRWPAARTFCADPEQPWQIRRCALGSLDVTVEQLTCLADDAVAAVADDPLGAMYVISSVMWHPRTGPSVVSRLTGHISTVTAAALAAARMNRFSSGTPYDVADTLNSMPTGRDQNKFPVLTGDIADVSDRPLLEWLLRRCAPLMSSYGRPRPHDVVLLSRNQHLTADDRDRLAAVICAEIASTVPLKERQETLTRLGRSGTLTQETPVVYAPFVMEEETSPPSPAADIDTVTDVDAILAMTLGEAWRTPSLRRREVCAVLASQLTTPGQWALFLDLAENDRTLGDIIHIVEVL